MRNAFLGLLAAVALVTLPSLAQAGGGGGTKPNSAINLTNNSTSVLVVFINLNAANLATVQGVAANTPIDANIQGQFNTLGGVQIDPGKSKLFSGLKAGNNVITAQFIGGTAAAPTTGVVGNTTVSLVKAKTTNLGATGAANAAPTIK